MTIAQPGLPLTIFAFLLVIGPLVFIHELGHYLAGRWFGVKADIFSIGFGREITGWTDRRGTRWKLCWLPLGGYVKFAGDMNPASQPTAEWVALPAEERNRTFQAKPVWQRFFIVAAGPLTNFLLAIVILAGFFTAFGEPRTPPIVGMVTEGSAAQAAGIRAGDHILSIAGRDVDHFEDIGNIVRLRPGETIEVGFERDGVLQIVTATPAAEVETDRFGNTFSKGLLGIANPRQEIVPVNVIGAVGAAVRQTREIIVSSVQALGQVITGRRSVKELGGPLKIAQYSGQQATLGPLAFIYFVALISINLGFINLLPIPLLDGGHLLFYTIEAIRRKPLRPEAQEWAFRTGLAALLALMIFVTLNDLASFGLLERLGGLIG